MKPTYTSKEELIQEILDNANRKGIGSNNVAYGMFLDGLGLTVKQTVEPFASEQRAMQGIETLLDREGKGRKITELISNSLAITQSGQGNNTLYQVRCIYGGELQPASVTVTDNLNWARANALAIESCLINDNTEQLETVISNLKFMLGY